MPLPSLLASALRPSAKQNVGNSKRAAREVKERGTFTYAADAVPAAEVSAHMLRSPR
jgi:hypothetical protein